MLGMFIRPLNTMAGNLTMAGFGLAQRFLECRGWHDRGRLVRFADVPIAFGAEAHPACLALRGS
jgi:hypothetical protein